MNASRQELKKGHGSVFISHKIKVASVVSSADLFLYLPFKKINTNFQTEALNSDPSPGSGQGNDDLLDVNRFVTVARPSLKEAGRG